MLRAGVATSIQLVAGLMLLFAGWGFLDLRNFFDQPARAALIGLAILLAGLMVAWGVNMQPIRRGRLSTGKQELQLGVLLALSLSLLWFLPFADRRNLFILHSSFVRYAGLVLCGSGGVVRVLALRRLGPQFSAYVTLQPGHQLVQSGIYGRIRHPLYLSLLLVPAGIAMVFASLLAFPVFVLAAIFVADRIKKEEQLLGEEFGAEFFAYRRRTRMLIPHLF